MGQPKEAPLTAEVAQQICERTASAAGSGRLDRQPWQPVCVGPARKELQHRGRFSIRSRCRSARREDVLNSLSEIAQRLQNPAGRIARDGGKAFDAACRCDDTVTRSPEGVQHRHEGDRPAGNLRPCLSSGALSKSIPNSPWRTRSLGLAVQRRWTSRCCRPQSTTKSVATAGSRQRSGEVLHRLHLRPAGDGKSGKGVPNPRVVAADISSRASNPMPRVCLGGLSTHGTGRFERVIEIAAAGNRGRSRLLFRVCQSCIGATIFLDRFEEAEGDAQRAAERKLDEPTMFS